jgi:hypothetical protein
MMIEMIEGEATVEAELEIDERDKVELTQTLYRQPCFDVRV